MSPSRTFHQVGKYLHHSLQKAKSESWNNFPDLVGILAKLETEGFHLADKNSRVGHTYQFRIKDRTWQLKPTYLHNVRKAIISLSDIGNDSKYVVVKKDLETMQLFNQHFLYMPRKEEKIRINTFQDLALDFGVHSHLEVFKRLGDLQALAIAQNNCSLTGRNFFSEVARYFNLPIEDVKAFLVRK